MSAVRLQLERERLETNRERIARGLGPGTGRPAAPAAGTSRYICKGFCIAWNKGGCSKDNCKFKHEVPPHKEQAQKKDKNKKDSLGRSRSRDGKHSGRSPPKKSDLQVLEGWTLYQGKHVNSSIPRASLQRRARLRHHKQLPRTQRGQSQAVGPKDPARAWGPDKPRKDQKKDGKSPKATPAAVCILASMLASAAQALKLARSGQVS